MPAPKVSTRKRSTKTKSTSSAHLKPEVTADLNVRLARIEGHVRAVRVMLDRGESCDDVMIQLAAVRSATTRVIGKLFEGHMDVGGPGEADRHSLFF